MWASSCSALESWCCHGQITPLECSAREKERAASYKLLSHDSPWTIKKSKGSSAQSLATTRKPEPRWEALNCVAAQSESLQQQGLRGQKVSTKTLSCSSSKKPQTRCFGSLSHPCSPRKQGLELFCWRWKFSNYLPQWGQIPFTNLFLRVSFSPSISVVFSSSFIVYILPPQNKNVSMWNVLYREGECRGRGIPAPDVTWRRSTARGQGKKHNRPCSEAETWSEQTNKVKAVKLNDCFYLFPCWFVFTLPLPCPQLCAPLESSHLALVFAGHGAYVYYIYFKHSSWETDSSLGIPNTFYNQLHYWYWDWRRGNGVFFRFIRFDL